MVDKVDPRARVYHGFWLHPADSEHERIAKGLSELAKKDGKSESDIMRTACLEYVQRHLPGNAQLDIRNFAPEDPLPLSQSARETLTKQAEKPRPRDPEVHFERMTLSELEAYEAGRKRLSDFDKMALSFFKKRCLEETKP